MVQRTCDVDGCSRKHVARGLCSTHYNQQHQPDRHRKVQVTCDWCGRVVSKALTSQYQGRYCGMLCRDAACSPRRACEVPPTHPSRSCAVPEDHPSRLVVCRVVHGDCADCGRAFVVNYKGRHKRFCSRSCSRRVAKRLRRGREFGEGDAYTWTQVVKLHLAFDRECAYCGCDTTGTFEPDHVVPLSRGGHNTISNILPACQQCNAQKRDRTLAEWHSWRQQRALPMLRLNWESTDLRYWHLALRPAQGEASYPYAA